MVARRAGEHLGRAGLRAFARVEVASAVNLLERAVALDDRDSPERAQQHLALSEALRYHGEPDRAREVHGEAAALVDRLGDGRLQGRALLGGAGLLFSFDTKTWVAEGSANRLPRSAGISTERHSACEVVSCSLRSG